MPNPNGECFVVRDHDFRHVVITNFWERNADFRLRTFRRKMRRELTRFCDERIAASRLRMSRGSALISSYYRDRVRKQPSDRYANNRMSNVPPPPTLAPSDSDSSPKSRIIPQVVFDNHFSIFWVDFDGVTRHIDTTRDKYFKTRRAGIYIFDFQDLFHVILIISVVRRIKSNLRIIAHVRFEFQVLVIIYIYIYIVTSSWTRCTFRDDPFGFRNFLFRERCG